MILAGYPKSWMTDLNLWSHRIYKYDSFVEKAAISNQYLKHGERGWVSECETGKKDIRMVEIFSSFNYEHDAVLIHIEHTHTHTYQKKILSLNLKEDPTRLKIKAQCILFDCLSTSKYFEWNTYVQSYRVHASSTIIKNHFIDELNMKHFFLSRILTLHFALSAEPLLLYRWFCTFAIKCFSFYQINLLHQRNYQNVNFYIQNSLSTKFSIKFTRNL